MLNFSDRTLGMFFDDYRVDIDDAIYRVNGNSKANRMRSFWSAGSNNIVGRVIDGLITFANDESCLPDDPRLIDECRKIAGSLLCNQPVTELEALTAISDERDFEAIAEHIREAIEKNQPEAALDRLHTFVIKFVRVICLSRGIVTSREKPLHSIFGEYVKAMRDSGNLESQMTERILKTSISVLEAFNDVRNNKSLAHDNPILNYEESLLIFNHVAASIRFIKALEMKVALKKEVIATNFVGDLSF